MSRVVRCAGGTLLVLLVSICRIGEAADGQLITGVVGNGISGAGGDGGPAIDALTASPTALALDDAGNLYIGDSQPACKIRKVSRASGIITTVAGGVCGFGGDGGPATAARLLDVHGIAIAHNGDVYFSDSSISVSRVRRVDAATGLITTVAGNGTTTFSGDGGPAIAAGLTLPEGIALDSLGDLYIADGGNRRVRKVAAATGIITTVAGSVSDDGFSGDGGPATAARLSHLEGLAFDSADNLYLVDRNNCRIRRIDRSSQIITTVAGAGQCSLGFGALSGDGGAALDARLNFPIGLAVDAGGTSISATRRTAAFAR